MKTTVKIRPNELTTETIEEMWEIYHQYYHYNKADFIARIPSNNYYVFYMHGKKIVGFTGLRINRVTEGKKTKVLIYFGQTIIQPQYRGKSLWAITGARVCWKFRKDLFKNDVYFWCDALSYKAYLVFAKTLLEYYPSRVKQMPEAIKNLVDYVGHNHYGQYYSAEKGIVRKPANLVKDEAASIPEWGKLDADVQFYAKANPTHRLGHGLITIAPVNRKNVAFLIKRYLYKSLGLPKPGKSSKKTIPTTSISHDYQELPNQSSTNSFAS